MSIESGQHPCASRSKAARLSVLRYCLSPFGKISMRPAGSKIEAVSEATTSKSKSSVIAKLILETVDPNVLVFSMVNDYRYWSVSGDFPNNESGQRKKATGATTTLSKWICPICDLRAVQ